MPMTVNGFGTSVCGSRGDVGWGSFDAMEWLVALYMPLVPYKSVHTFDWNGQQYRAIPIRWSLDLAVRTFLGRWLWGVGIIGLIFLIPTFTDKSGLAPLWLLICLFLVGLAVLIGVILRLSDRRNQDIRRVLGASTIGHCDPAYMTDDMLEQMAGEPRLAYGTETFAEAAEVMLERGSYARAMWAARVCVVRENRQEGEALTNRILTDADVARALEEVRRDGARWAKVMLTPEERNPPADQQPPDDADLPLAPPAEEVERSRRRASRRRDEDEDY
jgi:hypothetical protein